MALQRAAVEKTLKFIHRVRGECGRRCWTAVVKISYPVFLIFVLNFDAPLTTESNEERGD